MRQKLLLLAAVFFGMLAFFLTYQQIKAERERIRSSTISLNVIKVNRPLAEGDIIRQGDLVRESIRRYPKDISRNDIRYEDRANAIGAKVNRSINQGEMLRYSDISTGTSGKGGKLATLIGKGERAISISVDATSSVTGLIEPGDNVDIIGTFRFPEMKGDRSLDTITLTILQYVRVIATGTDMGGAGQPGGRRGKGYSTVTLGLTPKQVEMIVFASQKGRLTLSLRSSEEAEFIDQNDLQSVNFRFLEENIPNYNEEQEKRKRGVLRR